MKLSRVLKEYTGGGERLLCFQCPGCNTEHPFRIETADRERPTWAWNGNVELPTFTPSLIVFKDDARYRCHIIVTDGKIQFLGDCHHALAGRTVDMVEIDG